MRPDASVFPFADLLADLRRRGFGIGLHEYKDVAKLASRWQGIDRATFRDALAALLARNADEVARIREAFDQWADAEPPPPPPPPPPRPKLWTWHIVAAILALTVACGAGAWRYFERRAATKAEVHDVTPPISATTTADEPKSAEPALPPPPREPLRELPWIIAAMVVTAALLALAVREARRKQKQWTRRYWDHVLAHAPGPHHYEPNVARGAPPFPRSVMEEVASIVGRARETEPEDGDTLDVEETLRLTLRAGMAPHLRFMPPARNVPLLVLRDTAWQMRPWEAKVDYFVRELRRQGVLIEEWHFDGDPLHVSRGRDGRTLALESLALSRAEASLLILSSGQGARAESLRALERLLPKWSFRAWIHPVGNPEYWRRDLQSLPVRLWPMTRAGVRAAAVELARSGDPGLPPPSATPRSVTRGDVERMKQLLALAPNPTLELAEELRRRFCPDVPEEVILFLGAEGVFYGETIAFPPEQLRQLLASASRDPAREASVRRYLLEVLRESRPPEESAAHLRWQLDEAVQRLKLDPADEDARGTVRDLGAGALKDEVARAVELHGLHVAVDVRPPKELPLQPPRSMGRRPPLWAWPRLAAAAVAVVVLAPLTVLLARGAGVGEGAPIAHERGAYVLSLNENILYGNVAPGKTAPARARLYRDGSVYSTVDLDVPMVAYLVDDLRGSWVELRARLPKDNWATSHPLWVPRKAADPVEIVPPPPPWPDDEISRRVVRAIASFAGVPEGSVVRDAPLSDFGSERERRELLARIGKEFDVVLPVTLATPGAIADYVRAQPPKGATGTVVLTFVQSDGTPMRAFSYELAGIGVRRVRGRAGKPLNVEPGTYTVRVFPILPLNIAVGTIDVVAGETLRREFTLPSVDRWQHDDFSRKVVQILAAQLGSDQSKITPSRPRVGQDVIEAVGKALGTPFEWVPQNATMTPREVVDYAREQVALSSKPVPVVLRWVTTNGDVLDLEYELSGNGRTYSGVAGKAIKVLPGEYIVAPVASAASMDRIVVSPGQPYESTFRVRVSNAPDAGAALRRFPVMVKSTTGASEELWSQTALDVWYRDPAPETAYRLTVVEKTTVQSVRGVIVREVNGRQFFIPDGNEGEILTRDGVKGPWRYHGSIQRRAAAN